MNQKTGNLTLDYLDADLAGTFKSTAGIGSADDKQVDALAAELNENGYVILESIISKEQLDTYREEIMPHLTRTGRNNFEGDKTQRVYGVPGKIYAADPMIAHPLVMAVLDRVMRPNFLLSQGQGINILPGEVAQPIHHDDAFYHWPRPRPHLGAATIWAIDAFTEDNGATVVYPGSHKWGPGAPPADAKVVKAVMPEGSCVLFLGTTWHGGGGNETDKPRLAFTAQYCEPWCRTQENYFLAVPKEMVKSRDEAMQRLLGYSVHPPFIGMVNGMHPKRCLQDD
ncbi:phytanoyl-CoA dioxygenase family protein [Parvularcula sp. ZS-1/3]|uniref:Phytanoyl-CoA dioxygenase family protein n=1 Tax=Parvularcula mediterranea TaxID=2732508 RepID=A0A7Y3W4T1_9PROT|nr:phytanoyl-CoA dioxygenase family protein [Parvularcula mediterranea]